jgi:peptide/nickel transport system permease protein
VTTAAASEPDFADAAAIASTGDEGWPRSLLRAGIAVVGLVVIASVLVRLLGLDPNEQALDSVLEPPSLAHPFGTDDLGRDVFLRTVYASLTDLQIAVVATYLAVAIGLVLGVVAGFYRGAVDAVLMRITDLFLAFPIMVLVIAVVAIFGSGVPILYAALVMKGWPIYTRITRGEMLVLREQQFILAAQTLGLSRRRVVFRHALPHLLRANLVFSFSDVILSVLLLATLSFLGLGLQPPTPEWGAIIADGRADLLGAWWVATLPGVFLVVVGVGLSLTGEALAERLRIATGTV